MLYIYIYIICSIYFIYIQGYYLNFLDIYKTFYGETTTDFVIFCYLVLLSSIVSNACKGALFLKILPPQ